jgi:hypothetical protein
MSDWTIAGRAPCLVDATQADVIGKLSVINGAIYHEPIEPDYWVCADQPGKIVRREVPGKPWNARRRPVLVTKDSHGPHWSREFPELTAEQGVTVQTYGNKDHMQAALPWRTRVDWCHYSILLALYHAWVHGARRIRFIGVAMQGGAYAYSTATIENKNGPEWRWMRERRMLAEAMTELAEHGGADFERPFEPRWYTCVGCSKPYRLAFASGPMSCTCNRAGRLRGPEEPAAAIRHA